MIYIIRSEPTRYVKTSNTLENNGAVVVGFGPHEDNATQVNNLQQLINSHTTCSYLYSVENAYVDDKALIFGITYLLAYYLVDPSICDLRCVVYGVFGPCPDL